MATNEQDSPGQIHLYTGNGKGKTTAAFGLAVRALCAGKQVFIGQFVKSMKYNETQIEDQFARLTIEQFGCGCLLNRQASAEDLAKAKEGLAVCAKALNDPMNDVVILDEICIAIHLNLLTTEEVLAVLNNRLPHIEVVLTGRYAPQELVDLADLVTDMVEVKHYYTTKNLLSRNGIDK